VAVYAACLDPAATVTDADAALAAGGLGPARQALLTLLDCPGVDHDAIVARLAGTDALLAARAARAAGDAEQAVQILRNLAASDPTFPGLSSSLFSALLAAGRVALDAGSPTRAFLFCGEALAMHPSDTAAVQCVAEATPPTPEPSPTPIPTVAPTPSPEPPRPSPTPSAPAPTRTIEQPRPAPPTAAPRVEVSAAAPSCLAPSAVFVSPTARLGTSTTLLVAGLAPESPLTLTLLDAPQGYTAATQQLHADPSCQRAIPMLFRAAEHPTGTWTFRVQGTGPDGSDVELTASVQVVP
jgi:hypothetical protein